MLIDHCCIIGHQTLYSVWVNGSQTCSASGRLLQSRTAMGSEVGAQPLELNCSYSNVGCVTLQQRDLGQICFSYLNLSLLICEMESIVLPSPKAVVRMK